MSFLDAHTVVVPSRRSLAISKPSTENETLLIVLRMVAIGREERASGDRIISGTTCEGCTIFQSRKVVDKR
jgi:hypothetical protein